MLRHKSDNVGLRNGLPKSNRQRSIVICMCSVFDRHKFVSWYLSHCLQDAFVADPAARKLPIDHAATLCVVVLPRN